MTWDQYAFEERAAIRQYMGGFSQVEAERLARLDMRPKPAPPPDAPEPHINSGEQMGLDGIVTSAGQFFDLMKQMYGN